MALFTEPFRFRDLPAEIRNKIYRELLCVFAPLREEFVRADMFQYERVVHANDTAILRTNRQIYREAYDIMVKTNRFVKVTSVRGLPMVELMCLFRVPVVKSERTAVNHFNGYVLDIHLGNHNRNLMQKTGGDGKLGQPCSFIILFRDMNMFCEAVSFGDSHAPGFSQSVIFSIEVAPIVEKSRQIEYGPSFENFLTKPVQESILAPLRTMLKGYENVTISGCVDSALAQAVRADMAEERWSDPAKILAELQQAKESGSELFKEKKYDEAMVCWLDAAATIDTIQKSVHWPVLLRRADTSFIPQLVETYFIVRLNHIHVSLNKMRTPHLKDEAGILTEDAIDFCFLCMKKDHWMPGYTYKPTVPLEAKLRYRYAVYCRLVDEEELAKRAIGQIKAAVQLLPHDPVILQERQNIIEWASKY